MAWGIFVMAWLANSVRTRGVDASVLQSSAVVAVVDDATGLAFLPATPRNGTALVFICGSGITAEAYAPLLRPIAEAGFPVFIVRLPYRFAPFATHKMAALDRARGVMASHAGVTHWVIAGHSLGGALAARLSRTESASLSALILVGTTHPKDYDLSFLRIPVMKIYASNDGIAPVERIRASQGLLPASTTWVEIAGGNHSQFGRYGRQLFDGAATISREEQETRTRAAMLQVLGGVGATK